MNVIRTLPHAKRELAISAMQASFRQVFIAIAGAAFFAFLCLLPIQEFALPGSKSDTASTQQRESAINEEEEEDEGI